MTTTDADIERAGFNKGLEAAAKIAGGEVYETRYRTWPWWKPQADGNRANMDKDDVPVRHCDRIAEEIRKLKA